MPLRPIQEQTQTQEQPKLQAQIQVPNDDIVSPQYYQPVFKPIHDQQQKYEITDMNEDQLQKQEEIKMLEPMIKLLPQPFQTNALTLKNTVKDVTKIIKNIDFSQVLIPADQQIIKYNQYVQHIYQDIAMTQSKWQQYVVELFSMLQFAAELAFCGTSSLLGCASQKLGTYRKLMCINTAKIIIQQMDQVTLKEDDILLLHTICECSYNYMRGKLSKKVTEKAFFEFIKFM